MTCWPILVVVSLAGCLLCRAATVRKVLTGEVQFPTDAVQFDVPLPRSVDMSRSFLDFTYRHVEDAPRRGQLRVEFVDSATIRFDRFTASRKVMFIRYNVIEYADTVDGIKPEVATDIIALIDEGKLMEAAIALEALERDRTVVFNVQTRGAGRVNAVGSARAVHDGGMVVGGGIQSFAGLKDDEVPAVLQKGEAVLTPGQQAAMLGGGGGNTIINNYPAGWRDADDITNGRRRYDRIQGPM